MRLECRSLGNTLLLMPQYSWLMAIHKVNSNRLYVVI